MSLLSDLLEGTDTLSFHPYPVRVFVHPWNDTGLFQGRIEVLDGERVKTLHGPRVAPWEDTMKWFEETLLKNYSYVLRTLELPKSALERLENEVLE